MQQANTLPLGSLPDVLTKDQVRQLLAELETKQVFDTTEAARYLNVSKQLLELMRVRGDGPRFARLGGHRLVRYRRVSLDEWLALYERKSTSQP
jgi:predicted DNA-binding transcriptional regulator AlpA